MLLLASGDGVLFPRIDCPGCKILDASRSLPALSFTIFAISVGELAAPSLDMSLSVDTLFSWFIFFIDETDRDMVERVDLLIEPLYFGERRLVGGLYDMSLCAGTIWSLLFAGSSGTALMVLG